jgi:hypothetical protein
MNLFQRINEVRKEIAYVRKDKSVSTGKGFYMAVTHDMVTAIIREHMVTHGVVSFPSLVASQTVRLPDTNDGPAKQHRYEATYDFTFANMDDPADRLVIRIEAHAMDNADKAPGKALSYAKKYAVLKLFELETGEDEESRVARPEGMADNVLADYLASMDESATLDGLVKTYSRAFKAAQEAGDEEAKIKIIQKKDVRKKALTPVTP